MFKMNEGMKKANSNNHLKSINPKHVFVLVGR